MTILHAGGEAGAFIPSDGGAIEDTSGQYFDNAYARCSLLCNGSGSSWLSSVFPPTADVWFHFVLNIIVATSNFQGYRIYNNSGTMIFYLNCSVGSGGDSFATIQMFYYNGSGYTQVGAGFTTSGAVNTTFDLHINSSSAAIYANGTLQDSGTATMTDVTNISQYGTFFAGLSHYSELIASTASTIGYRLQTIPITGNGSNTGWTGTYTDVNEVVYNDGLFISAASANLVSTFAQATTAFGPIQAIVVTARALAGATGPQNIQLALKSGATTYFSSTEALGTGYGANEGIWATDPATGIAWTTGGADAIEYGTKSIT